jgi:hypothetical protein
MNNILQILNMLPLVSKISVAGNSTGQVILMLPQITASWGVEDWAKEESIQTKVLAIYRNYYTWFLFGSCFKPK